jgi:hypothetical protein
MNSLIFVSQALLFLVILSDANLTTFVFLVVLVNELGNVKKLSAHETLWPVERMANEAVEFAQFFRQKLWTLNGFGAREALERIISCFKAGDLEKAEFARVGARSDRSRTRWR